MTKISFGLRTHSPQEASVMPRATTIQQFPQDYRPSQAGVVMLSVKAQNGAIVYGSGGGGADAPIGEDDFQLVELNSTISQAIIDRDLVKDPAHPKPVLTGSDEPVQGPQKRMYHIK